MFCLKGSLFLLENIQIDGLLQDICFYLLQVEGLLLSVVYYAIYIFYFLHLFLNVFIAKYCIAGWADNVMCILG